MGLTAGYSDQSSRPKKARASAAVSPRHRPSRPSHLPARAVPSPTRASVRARKAEEQCGRKGAERAPAAEDQGGERDEAPTRGHVLGERVDESDREEDAAECCQGTGEGDRRIAGAVDGDAERIGRLRMLP